MQAVEIGKTCKVCGRERDIIKIGEFAGLCRPCFRTAASSKHDNPGIERVREYLAQCPKRPTIRSVATACGISSVSVAMYYIRRAGGEAWIPKYDNRHGTNASDVREAIIEMLGGKCVRCGFTDIRALQIDHIHSNGSIERRALGQRRMFEKMLHEVEAGNYSNYQVLCCNCNWIKRYENDEWAHGRLPKKVNTEQPSLIVA